MDEQPVWLAGLLRKFGWDVIDTERRCKDCGHRFGNHTELECPTAPVPEEANDEKA